jgi:hypothetical protein
MEAIRMDPTRMTKHGYPPLIMTIPGGLMLLMLAAMCAADIALPYRETMDFSIMLMPFVALALLAFVVGYVVSMARIAREK